VNFRTSGMTGLCYDVQRYSIHDGPGIRTTLFFKGCPLACDWCQNPESQDPAPQLYVVSERCARCGACIEACPQPADIGPDGEPRTSVEHCQACGACTADCAADARRIVGLPLTVEQMLDQVERDRPFFEESGGGVTFSGGEPRLQGRFLLACLRACRDAGLHTTVDTCGYCEQDLILDVARWTDLFLYDLKTVDDERHRQSTGVSVAPVLANLNTLIAAQANLWIRVPLVPGFNDDKRSLVAIGECVAGLAVVPPVHLLPYHQIGSHKYERLHRPEKPADRMPPSVATVTEAKRLLEECGLRVKVGG